MSSSKSSDLFYLIKAMTKAEKRTFKLYAKRGGGTKHLFIKLFDLLDGMESISDSYILDKMKIESRSQYSNLKRHLYSQIMSSLRMLNVDKQPNIKVREYIDMAYVLYGKGLYLQALNILKVAKQLCQKYGTDLSLLTIVEIEKNIHSRHITRLRDEEFEQLIKSTESISHSITDRILLTNLKMNLHKQYLRVGHVKNEKELIKLTTYFQSKISTVEYKELGTMEQIYYCQCYVWYYYIVDDYRSCLKYAKLWVDIFNQSIDLQRRDYNLYLRGYHYVLTSAFNIADLETHQKYQDELEKYRKDTYSKFDKNNKIFSFLYTHTARLNSTFLSKDFQKGLNYVPKTLARLKRYRNELDQHKIMVMHYKIAWIYIGAGMPHKALIFLESIISLQRKSLREDIQSYARIMHLMALYDMEDFDGILKVLRKYKYYFEQVKEINQLQVVALKYFNSISTAPLFEKHEIHINYHAEFLRIKKNKFEKRAYLYLDIIYWMERKIKK